MDWARQVDGYCERVDFSFWAETLNAVTNLAFIVVAVLLWRRNRGLVLARVLTVILFVIGVGSFLFHTFATQWAGLADVVPIGQFIAVYFYATNWHIAGLRWWLAGLVTLGFFPYAAGMVLLIEAVPFLRISNFYWTVPLLLVVYAGLLRRNAPVAQGFVIGGLILSVSIVVRSLDLIVCDWLPFGTHFIWHLLNALMLGWMIWVYRRHMLATRIV